LFEAALVASRRRSGRLFGQQRQVNGEKAAKVRLIEKK
jgi:hypothetical protein